MLKFKCCGLLFALALWAGVFTAQGTEHKFILDSIDKIKEDHELVKNNLVVDSHDDEMVINGEFETLIDFDDEWKVNIEILRSDDGKEEYTSMMKLPPKGICELMKSGYKKNFYDTLKNHCNAPSPDDCPVKKDKFTVNKYPIDSSKFQKFMKPGYYRVHMILQSSEDSHVVEYSVNGHVVEV